MENIIYEIVGGALILGVVMTIIILFRQGATTVREATKVQASYSDINTEELVGIDGAIYRGTKVTEAYKYSLVAETGSDVWVQDGTTYQQITNTNAEDFLLLNSAKRYKLELIYSSTELTGITPTGTEGDRRQGDLDVIFVRYLFIRQTD